MNLHNVKTKAQERGFTIVELLIVIVVIGILAAIVIVAYNGITQRANASAAKANAASVKKVAESFNAQCPDTSACSGLSGYPTMAQLTTYSGNASATTKLPTGITIQNTAALTSSNADGKTITYKEKGSTGACIGYWDASANAVAWLYTGDATTGGNAAPATCS